VAFYRQVQPPQPMAEAYHLVKCGLLPQAVELMTVQAEQAEADNRLDDALDLYNNALHIFPDESSIRTSVERLRALVS
jgi:hypothetical protein